MSILSTLANRYRLSYVFDRISRRRPHYAFCMLKAAELAAALGKRKVSAIEFGVANGAGLAEMELIAKKVERMTGVELEIYGFDRGAGLPKPQGYRDLPYWFSESLYGMHDRQHIGSLQRSELVIGEVGDTVRDFIAKYAPAPIGCVLNDLDFYSSTVQAMRIFDFDEGSGAGFLPRVLLYFDDILGSTSELYGDFTGQRLAIDEFNATHVDTKISPIYALAPFFQRWHHKCYSLHFHSHTEYERPVFTAEQQRMEGIVASGRRRGCGGRRA